MIRELILKVTENQDLTREEAARAMNEIMSGNCTDAQIACFLTALRFKGETAAEIAGCAQVMRDKATRISAPEDVVDVVGTGGDSQGTFNVSTTTAIIVAGAGAIVAKHGNRSVSSTSGSADALRTLGVNIEATPECMEKCLSEAGIAFLFAPTMHSAMKHAIGPRREMGIRTIFNILGPLTNPANARHLLVGVYSSELVPTVALALKELGAKRAMVVHSHDGMDEISIADETTVAELKDREINEYVIAPEDFGIERSPLEPIKVSDSEESAKLVMSVLEGKPGPARDIALLNAGATLYVAEKAADMMEGVALAKDAIDSGKAKTKLEQFVTLSNPCC